MTFIFAFFTTVDFSLLLFKGSSMEICSPTRQNLLMIRLFLYVFDPLASHANDHKHSILSCVFFFFFFLLAFVHFPIALLRASH